MTLEHTIPRSLVSTITGSLASCFLSEYATTYIQCINCGSGIFVSITQLYYV